MRRGETHRTLITLLLAVALVGCGDETLEILGNSEPDAETCRWRGAQDGPFSEQGVMDIWLTKRYVVAPVVRNNSDPSRSARKREAAVNIDGAHVTFTSAAPAIAAVLQPELFIPVGAVVFPNGVTTVPFSVIFESLGRQLENTSLFDERGATVDILAQIRFEGTTLGGSEVTSDTFTYPITICAGCLLDHTTPPLFDDDDGSLTCDVSKAPPETPNLTDFASVCVYGQDDPVDCRLCRGVTGDPTASDVICDP